jgi:hypothetical protein
MGKIEVRIVETQRHGEADIVKKYGDGMCNVNCN